MQKIISQLDNEFTDWINKDQILPSRLEIFAAGYLAGVKVTKESLEELFLEEFNKKVEHGFNNRSN